MDHHLLLQCTVLDRLGEGNWWDQKWMLISGVIMKIEESFVVNCGPFDLAKVLALSTVIKN